jgi:phenylalanine-4-hydroxylase
MDDLETISIFKGKRAELIFESGIRVEGLLKNIVDKNGKNLIMSFTDCTVELGDQKLFLPEWGDFDMALGAEIVSAYNGPADPHAFGLSYPAPVEKTHKIQHSDSALQLHKLYERVAEYRSKAIDEEDLTNIWHTLEMNYPADWLIRLDILELLPRDNRLHQVLQENLKLIKRYHPNLTTLINNGLALLKA